MTGPGASCRWMLLAFAVGLFPLPLMGGQEGPFCPAGFGPRDAPNERYMVTEPVIGEFVVTDLYTGLMWKRCPEGLHGVSCSSGGIDDFDQNQALLRAESATHAGFSDWRVPNRNELFSLVETRCYSPAINGTRFPGNGVDVYWSSTRKGGDMDGSTDHYGVFFASGTESLYPPATFRHLRLVRGGAPGDDFVARDLQREVVPLLPVLDQSSVAAAIDAAGRYVLFESRASGLPGANGDSAVYRLDTGSCTAEGRVLWYLPVGNVDANVPLPLLEVAATLIASPLSQQNPGSFSNTSVWPISTSAGFLPSRYVSFTVSPRDGSSWRAETLRFSTSSYASSEVALHLRSSIDGFAGDIGVARNAGSGSRNWEASFDLSALGQSLTGSIEFRLYPTHTGAQSDFIDLRGADFGGSGLQLEGAAGCGRIERVSVDDGEQVISGDTMESALSADGSLAVFVAADAGVMKLHGEWPKAAAERRKAGQFGVYLRNMQTGTTVRVGPAAPGGANTRPRVAPGGGAVVFTGGKPGAAPGLDVYRVPLVDAGAGPMPDPLGERCVSCMAVLPGGGESQLPADGSSRNAVVSADGLNVVFESDAKNLQLGSVPACPDAATRLYLRNMLTGVVRPVATPPAGGGCGAAGSASGAPQIDYSGLRIAFESDQPLKPRTTPPQVDAYVVDLSTGALQRLSEGDDGADANGRSRAPVLSGDGRFAGFVSEADNLDPADGNGVADLFMRPLGGGRLGRQARTPGGGESNGASERPLLDYTGDRLLFDSDAGNLAPDAVAGVGRIYLRKVPQAVDALFYAGFE